MDLKVSQPGIRFTLFRTHGIRVALDSTWFIVFLLVFWSLSLGYLPARVPGLGLAGYLTTGLVATLLFFGSLLAHELTHSYMAIRSGIPVPEITLFIFGGAAQISSEPKSPAVEFKIAVVGPLSSLVLAAAFWLAGAAAGPRLHAVMDYLFRINVAVAIFNLVPGFPLDGGRIFRAFWWWKTGSINRATQVASRLGQGFAVFLMFLGAVELFSGGLLGGMWIIFIGMFLRSIARGGYRQLVLSQVLEDARVEDVMLKDIVSVPPNLPLSQAVRQYFYHYAYTGFPVADDGHVLGILSLDNLRDVGEDRMAQKTVADVMVRADERSFVAPELPLREALRKMLREGTRRLLVVKEHRVAGMLTAGSLARLLEIKSGEGERPHAGHAENRSWE